MEYDNEYELELEQKGYKVLKNWNEAINKNCIVKVPYCVGCDFFKGKLEAMKGWNKCYIIKLANGGMVSLYEYQIEKIYIR